MIVRRLDINHVIAGSMMHGGDEGNPAAELAVPIRLRQAGHNCLGQGTEFSRNAMPTCAEQHVVALHFIVPGTRCGMAYIAQGLTRIPGFHFDAR